MNEENGRKSRMEKEKVFKKWEAERRAKIKKTNVGNKKSKRKEGNKRKREEFHK